MSTAYAINQPSLCAQHAWQAFSGGDLARCAVCHLVSTARTPSFAYEDGYFSDESRGGYDFDSEFSRDFDAARFEPELDRLERQGLKGSVLDIGCATGTYLTAAHERGWRVHGVEVAEFGREETRRRCGAEVVESCDALAHGATFDVVTLHHVLEHITEPKEFLEQTVKPRVGRRLLIEVPNFGSLGARVHGRQWRDLRLEQHVCHYTPETLPALVTSAGLRVVKVYTLWQPLWSLRATVELLRLTLDGARGVDRRWDDVAAGSSPLSRETKTAYRTPGGGRKAVAAISHVACRPVIAGLERLGLGERLVVEAAPQEHA